MDSTIVIFGILAVVVVLVAYLWLPEWLRNRRMQRELQKRHAPPTPPVHVPPPTPHKEKATKTPAKKP